MPIYKPKLLIIGHARHGKDSVAEILADSMELKFTSSSDFVGREVIWEWWGKERYRTYHEMFEDRVNHRALWANLISAYNTPNKSKTAETMLGRGNHMYVGMRMRDELNACKEKGTFDVIIWVDGSKRHPPEHESSMQLVKEDADIIIDNNGNLMDLLKNTDEAVQKIYELCKKRGLYDE